MEYYHCKICDWIGKEPLVNKEDDPYDSDTQLYYFCPQCFEPVESLKNYISKTNPYGLDH